MLWKITVREPYCREIVFETEAKSEAEAINNARYRFCQKCFGGLRPKAFLQSKGVRFEAKPLLPLGAEVKHPV